MILPFFCGGAILPHIFSTHDIYMWWRLNAMSFNTKLGLLWQQRKKVGTYGAVCIFSFQPCWLFFSPNQKPHTANYTKKRRNHTALHTATHHKCVSLCVCMSLWRFHKSKRKKQHPSAAAAMCRLRTHTLTHTELLISGCYFM